MDTLFSFEGKTVVITGGGSGIGQAIAERFAQHGASVFILEKNTSAAQDTVARISASGKKAVSITCDISKHMEVRHVINEIINQTGRIHVLINNAGIAHIGKLETTSEDDFDRLYQVNIKGAYNVMHGVIGSMKQKGGGVILNLASIAGSLGIPDRFAYSMTKGAMISMTLSVARDYIGDNIRCNCISPARVHTPFVDGFLKANYPGQEKEMFERLSKTQPIGRMGKPEEIATLALYLCSDEASFITGCDYLIDGGFVKLNT